MQNVQLIILTAESFITANNKAGKSFVANAAENCLDIAAVLSAQCIETLAISWNSEIKHSKKTLNKDIINI